jgi:glycosyltransferase involved in cell wall biosynthesis
LKLLHLGNHYPPYAIGQSERQCRLVVNELTARGHFNRILTSNYTLPDVPDRERLVTRRLRLNTSNVPGPYAPLVWTERVNRRALLDEIEEVPPDVVLIWSMSGLSNSLIWELHARRIPMVFAVLDHWPRQRLREDPWMRWWSAALPLPQRAIRRLLRMTFVAQWLHRRYPIDPILQLPMRHAFFASRALRESIRVAGLPVADAPVIPYCIGRDEIPGQPQRRDEPRRLLWIGKLDTDRDPMTAVQAIQELRHHGQHQFTLDMFGRGEPVFESRIHDYVREAQLGGAVTLRHASVEEMVSLFPTYDLFLYTARYPEPFPIVVLRAMAARLPVVSTLEGACGEILRNGENCQAFRTGDHIGCATAVRSLAADRELVDRITDSAYRQLLDEHSAVVVAGRIERILQQTLRDQESSGR